MFPYETPETPAPLTGEARALHQRLETIVQTELQAIAGASLLELLAAQQRDVLRIVAIVRTPHSMKPAQVQGIEAALRQQVYPQTELIVRSVVGTDATATGYLPKVDSAQLLQQMRGVSPTQ